MGFPSIPYFLYLHYFGLAIAHSHFYTLYTVHEFATFLSPSSFRLVCFLKAHLFILWVYDPLFLPLRFNGFSIYLVTLFCPCCWASSFYWASQNEHQQFHSFIFHSFPIFMYILFYSVSFIPFRLNNSISLWTPIKKKHKKPYFANFQK